MLLFIILGIIGGMNMSKEYIEREAPYRDIKSSVVFSAKNVRSAEMRGASKIMERIKCATAADVVDVKHGRWMLQNSGNGTCSVCGRTTVAVWDCGSSLNYRHNCGARMDGEG